MRPIGWLLLTSAVSLWNASPAYAWGSKGHEIIAAIAETQLTDTARKRIKELLPQGTTLADASTWPDSGSPDTGYGCVPLRQLPQRREHIRPAARLQAAQLRHRGNCLVCAGAEITRRTAQ